MNPAHAGPVDILLVVEVAESSIHYDSTVKAALYARLGVVEFWLVDLNTDVITRYLDPLDGTYRRVVTATPDQPFVPSLLPECVVTTRDILG